MGLKFTMKTDLPEKVSKILADRSNKAEHVVAVQAMKDTSPFVPFRTGSLNTRARVDGNEIVYPGPYARYLYYGVKMVDAATGKGPMRYTDKYGNETIRFRKGATLKPTSEPLEFTTDFHKDAGPAWFDRSKAQNADVWKRVAQKVIDGGR